MIRRCLFVLLVASLSALPLLCAQVDQKHWPSDFKVSGYFPSFPDLRQEFTPTLSSLDSVELALSQGVLHPVYPRAGSAALAIRRGAADGPVIATSSSLFIPPDFRGTVVFRFMDSVGLTPGETYAFQPFSLIDREAGWWFNGSTPDDGSAGYPGGRMYFDGNFIEGSALYFREGIGLIPEPSPSRLWAVAAALTTAIVAWRGKAERAVARR